MNVNLNNLNYNYKEFDIAYINKNRKKHITTFASVLLMFIVMRTKISRKSGNGDTLKPSYIQTKRVKQKLAV